MWKLPSAYQKQYINDVNRIISDDNTFNNFKRYSYYNSVIGYSEPLCVQNCYKTILKHPDVVINISKFLLQEEIGNSDKYCFAPDKSGNKISGNLIRNIETICLLKEAFGDLNNKNILEFGCSFGQLTGCILVQWPDVKCIHLIDLPEVLKLAEKYLSKIPNIDVKKINFKEPEPSVVMDVAISEYGLSEITPETIEEYYNKYFKSSDNIFLRSNITKDVEHNQFIELLKKTFELTINDEKGSTFPNKVVIGKRRKK